MQVASPEPSVAPQLTALTLPETLRVGVTPVQGAPEPLVRVTVIVATSVPLARMGPLTERTAVGVDTRAFPADSEKRPGQMRPHPAWVKTKIMVVIKKLNLEIVADSFCN